MNTSLYRSTNPELAAKLDAELKTLKAEEQELANRKAEVTKQGDKISLGFKVKANQAAQAANRAQYPKTILDEQVAIEVVKERIVKDIADRKAKLDKWVAGLNTSEPGSFLSDMEWATNPVETAREMEQLQNFQRRIEYATEHLPAGTLMTLEQMDAIMASWLKQYTEEALRACRASHSTSMFSNAVEMAKSEVDAKLAQDWWLGGAASMVKEFYKELRRSQEAA